MEAKREETEALDVRYGKLDVDAAIDWGSGPLLVLSSLKDGVRAGSGLSKGDAFEDVMKTNERASAM